MFSLYQLILVQLLTIEVCWLAFLIAAIWQTHQLVRKCKKILEGIGSKND